MGIGLRNISLELGRLPGRGKAAGQETKEEIRSVLGPWGWE